MYNDNPNKCLECNCNIYTNESDYSISKFGIPLCKEHQKWIEHIEKITTHETISLYFQLKYRKVPVEIEKYDGFKHIDIAIPSAGINIEVDGQHHNYNKYQALADLKRTFYSYLRGYITIRIPNTLTYDIQTINETADYLAEMIHITLRKQGKY